MLKLLIEKELKNILQSPKFVATFAVCSVLILVSVFIGVQEYRSSVRAYETANGLVKQQIAEATSFWMVSNRVYRKPSPMQIFVSGVNFDVGRVSRIDTRSDVKLVQSPYSDEPLFAVFRFIDLSFIVQVVLSLFAILFTYDAVNGEKESGTLALTLSNAVPRGKFLFSKFAGSWLALTVPLLIPLLIGLLLVIVFNVPMDGSTWAKILTLLAVSILYFTFFIALGLLVSSMTRRSSVSFLILLVIWIGLVLIVPRGATMAAGQLIHVPTVSEIDSQKDRYRTDKTNEQTEERSAKWTERMKAVEGKTQDERRAYFDQNRSAWREEDDEKRDQMEAEIADHDRLLNEGLRNAKSEQENLAFILSRFSPASAYQLAAMNLAGTNTSIKKRYEDQMTAYKESFSKYVSEKQRIEREKRMEEARKSGGGRRIMFMGSGAEPVDASDMPRFTESKEPIAAVLGPSILDLGLLSLFTLLAFVGAFLAFLRYDVR